MFSKFTLLVLTSLSVSTVFASGDGMDNASDGGYFDYYRQGIYVQELPLSQAAPKNISGKPKTYTLASSAKPTTSVKTVSSVKPLSTSESSPESPVGGNACDGGYTEWLALQH